MFFAPSQAIILRGIRTILKQKPILWVGFYFPLIDKIPVRWYIRSGKGCEIMYSILIADSDYYRGLKYKNLDIWQRAGFQAEYVAISEEKALDYIKKYGVDLVLTELSGFQLNGISLPQKISENYKQTLVVFFTASRDFEAARQCIRLDIADYLLKPAGDEEILSMLERIKKRLVREVNTDLSKPALNVISQLQAGQDSKFIRKVALYLSDNIYNMVTMDNASEHLRLNKDYFGKRFKKESGITFGEFYKRLRIEYGKFLLDKGNLRVYEISGKLGFSHPDLFTATFREVTGIAPTKYVQDKK